MRLSDEYIINHRNVVGLIDIGEFNLEKIVLNDEEDVVYLMGTYFYCD